jgi:hypothetical protein
MSDSSVVIDATMTVLAGVIVLVIGQLLLRIFVQPIGELRKEIGKTIYLTIYYGHTPGLAAMLHKFNKEYQELKLDPEVRIERDEDKFNSRVKEVEKAREDIRANAASIVQLRHEIPLYPAWACLGFVPSHATIKTVSKELIGFSNATASGDEQLAYACVNLIREKLKVDRRTSS